MRLRRSPAELARHRRACELSRDGHIEAMRYARPGMYEYQVQAAVDLYAAHRGPDHRDTLTAINVLGVAYQDAGQPARALDRIDAAIRLNPRDPSIWTFQAGRALALFFLDRLDEAADWAHRSTQSVSSGVWSHGIEAAVLAHLGRKREAAAALGDIAALNALAQELAAGPDATRDLAARVAQLTGDFEFDGLQELAARIP